MCLCQLNLHSVPFLFSVIYTVLIQPNSQYGCSHRHIFPFLLSDIRMSIELDQSDCAAELIKKTLVYDIV